MSGIIGLGIGDFALFAAFVIIGPRRSVLMMAMSPIFAAFGALILLDEMLSPFALLGIAVTLAGIIIVILEREAASDEKPLTRTVKIRGTALAFVGAVSQGIGLVFAKKGMLLFPDNGLNVTLSATLIRMMAGALFVWAAVIICGKLPELRRAFGDRRSMAETSIGAFLGPFIGVTLSMVAVLYTHAGVAQTLMSLQPVIIIPVIWLLYKQKTSWRGIAGAIIAVMGVAILFLI
jgi:drug/metabolite transporter (DMT)-like permease